MLTFLLSLFILMTQATRQQIVGNGWNQIKFTQCEQDYPVPGIIVVKNGDTLNMEVKKGKMILYDYEEHGCKNGKVLEMTTRQYCINSMCGIPAPTLVVKPGIKFNIKINNKLQGDTSRRVGPDVANLHSHGLHISGKEDNVFIKIPPQNSFTYTWTIHPNHHLGTQWYHGHNHKSSSLQVMGGMFGALIVSDGQKYFEAENQWIIQLSWMFAHDKKYCNAVRNGRSLCTFQYAWNRYVYWEIGKGLMSYCAIWCMDNTPQQRAATKIKYDAKLFGRENGRRHRTTNPLGTTYTVEESFEGFIINGKLKPHIKSMYTNEWNLLRIIGASSEIYVQLVFPRSSAKCEYWAMARDGIMYDSPNDLSKSPFFGRFLMPAGGRLDVAMRCRKPGKVMIYHDEEHPRFSQIVREYAMGRVNIQTLFYIHIKTRTSGQAKNIGTTPPKVWGFDANRRKAAKYLRDLENLVRVRRRCPCRNDFRRTEHQDLFRSQKCGFEFRFAEPAGWDVNGIAFNPQQALFILQQDQVYQMVIYSHGHPFHIHVNPFQVMTNVHNGFVVRRGDWCDTIGVKKGGIIIRMRMADFDGNYILHCHFLTHEDAGMMGFIKVANDSTVEECFNRRRRSCRNWRRRHSKCDWFYDWSYRDINYASIQRRYLNSAKTQEVHKLMLQDSYDEDIVDDDDVFNKDTVIKNTFNKDTIKTNDIIKTDDITKKTDDKKIVYINRDVIKNQKPVNTNDDLYKKVLNLMYISMAYSTLLCFMMIACIGTVVCVGVKKFNQKNSPKYSQMTSSASETE